MLNEALLTQDDRSREVLRKAYYIPIETLYQIEQAALIYLISDGSSNEFLFTTQQMTFYKELWLERLSQINERVSLAA